MSSLPAVRTQQNSLIMLSLPEIQERAQILVKSGLLPESIKTPEQAIVIALKGQELGLPMLQSFEDLFVIKGKVGMFTRLMITRYLDRGHWYQIVESSATRCAIKFTRREGRTYEHVVTLEEAQKAKWDQAWDSETKSFKAKMTWGNPRVMLMWACFRNGIKFFAPDVLDPDMLQADVVDGQMVMPDDEQGGDVIIEGSSTRGVPAESARPPVEGPAESPKEQEPQEEPQEGPADWTRESVRGEFAKAVTACKFDAHDALAALAKAAGKPIEKVRDWSGSLSAAVAALEAYAAERDGVQPAAAQAGLF